MDIREKFTDKEWEMLIDAPFVMGLAVSDSDQDPGSCAREFEEIIQVCGEGEGKYQDNPLISAVLSETGTFIQIDKPDRENADALKQAAIISTILKEKLPGREGEEFKSFLLEVAKRVANAYGEGFLGLGDKVSPDESEFLGRLSAALELQG
jgi:hypothetical protein